MENNEVNADNTASDVTKEAEVKTPLVSEARKALYEKYQTLQSASAPVTAESTSDVEQKESVSDTDSSVKESNSDSSSVKEAKPKEGLEKEIENRNKALSEERERRREANRRVREMQAKYDADIKALNEKIDAMAKPRQSMDDSVSFDPTQDALRKENELLKQRFQVEEQRKAQETQVQAQKQLQDKIQRVTKELKDDKYPGFQYALAKVDAAILKRVNDGDLLPEDATDPKVWKQVYIEDVYNEFIGEFKEVEKHEKLEAKKANKAKANLAGTPGSNPNAINEGTEETPFTMEDANSKYMQTRKAKNPSIRRY